MASTSSPTPPPPPPPPPNMPPGFEERGPGPGPTFGRPQSPFLVVFMNVTNSVTQLVLGSVAFSAFFFINQFDGSDHLKQHIYLCVTGYVILMSQAILAFNPHSSFTHNLKYPSKKLVHWLMQVAGSTVAITGSIIRLANVNNPLQTPHGILGFIAMLMTSVSLVGGVLKLFCEKPLSNTIPKVLHACVGALTLSVAFLCLCFGFNDLYRDIVGDVNANLSIALTIIGLVGTLLMTFLNLTRRICCST